MDSVEINFVFVAFQIKSEITEKPDAESAVQIMFQHMMDHIKDIFCRRKHGISVSMDSLSGFLQVSR